MSRTADTIPARDRARDPIGGSARPPRSWPAGLGLAVILFAAACTSGAPPDAAGPAPAGSGSSGPDVTASSTAGATSPTAIGPVPTSAPARTTAGPASSGRSTRSPRPKPDHGPSSGSVPAHPSPSFTATPAPVTTHPPAPAHQPRCAVGGVRVGAQRGSGALQMQYATITVRNTARTSCWLVGFATVQLRAGGRPLGPPAEPARRTAAALELRAGQQATAVLSGPSTCNAGVSDHVRVSLPQSPSRHPATSDLALPMRGCPLSIAAFTRPRS